MEESPTLTGRGIFFSLTFYFHFNTVKQREKLNDRTELTVTTLSLKKQTERQQQQKQIIHAKNRIYTELHNKDEQINTLAITPQV